LARRDTKEKQTVPQAGLSQVISNLLTEIQTSLFQKALAFRDSMIHKVEHYEQFKDVLENKGGFISAHWDGTPETEELIKQETKATIRCIPLNNTLEEGVCIYSGKPSTQRVLFAKAY
jgi:prolyl-tRNA synthetase